MNRVILVGNLGGNPELRHTSGGTPVCTMRMATNEYWSNAEGERKERTEWHNVTVWGRNAENCQKFLSKGHKVLVEGRLQTREYEGKDGNKRWFTEVVAERVEFIRSPATSETSDEIPGYDGGGASREENGIPF